MYKFIEIIISVVAVAGAVGFFIWYFIREIRGNNVCAGCKFYNSCSEFKIKKKLLKNKKMSVTFSNDLDNG